jgi:hypothetical protein
MMIEIYNKATGDLLCAINPDLFEVRNHDGSAQALDELPEPKYVVTAAGATQTVEFWEQAMGGLDAAIAAGLVALEDAIPTTAVQIPMPEDMKPIGHVNDLTAAPAPAAPTPPVPTPAPAIPAPPPVTANTQQVAPTPPPAAPNAPVMAPPAPEANAADGLLRTDLEVPEVPGREYMIGQNNYRNVIDSTGILFDNRIHAVSRDKLPAYKKGEIFKKRAGITAEFEATIQATLRAALGQGVSAPAEAAAPPAPAAPAAPTPPPAAPAPAAPPEAVPASTVSGGVDQTLEDALSGWDD